MKFYILFDYEVYYPEGGLKDARCVFWADDDEAAIKYVEGLVKIVGYEPFSYGDGEGKPFSQLIDLYRINLNDGSWKEVELPSSLVEKADGI